MSKRTSHRPPHRHESNPHLVSAQTIIGELVDPSPDGCWLWTGPVHTVGYGIHPAIDGYVHRFVYETLVGLIPDGHVVHHRCEVKTCVRPDHLELMTRAAHSAGHARERLALTKDRQELLRAALWIGERMGQAHRVGTSYKRQRPAGARPTGRQRGPTSSPGAEGAEVSIEDPHSGGPQEPRPQRPHLPRR